ncbi:MAG: DivIVA domain-containing protein [Lactovum sp.]
MTLSSLDVVNKTFSQKMRGYDRQEVDEFLEIVIKDYEEMAQKIKNQEREIKSMNERLSDFTNMKESLNRSIIIAQETADNVKSQAEANATRIRQEASQRAEQTLEKTHREARKILRDTYDEARRLVNESDELKRGMRNYYQRTTMLIEGQLASIKSSDWEEILRPSPIYVGDTEEKLREIIEHTNQHFLPVNERGEVIQRSGEKSEETLDSFAQALNPNSQPVSQEQELVSFKADSEVKLEPIIENIENKMNSQDIANYRSQPHIKSNLNAQNNTPASVARTTSNQAINAQGVSAQQLNAQSHYQVAKENSADSTVNLGGTVNFSTNNNNR